MAMYRATERCDSCDVSTLLGNSLIASISINFRSDEAVRVTTDRFAPTGSVPLPENRLAGRESVDYVRSP
jgi:hypothetical protein